MQTHAANPLEGSWGALVGALCKAFESGDQDRLLDTLDRLGNARERALYRDLRILNASLNRTLEEFRSNSRLASLAGKEMPDARVRLDHVLKLTEEAAHRTLDLVERSGPMADRLAKDAAALLEPLRQARSAGLGAGFEDLLTCLETFLGNAQRDGDSVRANLAEVLMAQSYQDLSGQIIRTVITLVAELERTLAHFAGLAGDHIEQDSTPGVASRPADSHGFGPAVPGLSGAAVGEQEDVDELLAKMGM